MDVSHALDVPTYEKAEELKRREGIFERTVADMKGIATTRVGYAGLPWNKLEFLVQQQRIFTYPGHWLTTTEAALEETL